jgi:hypothetical protein
MASRPNGKKGPKSNFCFTMYYYLIYNFCMKCDSLWFEFWSTPIIHCYCVQQGTRP